MAGELKMDVREKLVEILRKPIFPHELVDPIEAVADYLLDSGVTVQEWISTDERMPTQENAPTEYVFIAYKNQNGYDVKIALWDTVVAYPDLYDYWMAMPLPQPPKGE